MKPRASPVEVKSGKRYPTTLLNKFRAKFGKRMRTEYLLYPKPLASEGNRSKLSLYMALAVTALPGLEDVAWQVTSCGGRTRKVLLV